MLERANQHYGALQQIIPDIKRLMLFDYDSAEEAFHPPPENRVLYEWKRKNIENYLLVPDAWKRAALKKLGAKDEQDMFARPIMELIDGFFAGENLTLPPGKAWRTVGANIFSLVDGKRILFENDDALFQQLRQLAPTLYLLREQVAMAMAAEEIHEDVHRLMNKVNGMLTEDKKDDGA